jgi:hypothetical protein
MAGSLRDRLGHFLPRQAMAAEAVGPEEAAAVAELDEQDVLEDVLPVTPADIHRQLAEQRGLRAALLRDGDVSGVVVVDREIERLGVVLEAWQARSDRLYDEAIDAEHARRAEAWRTLQPRLTAARVMRDYRTALLFEALGEVVDLEAQAEALGIALGDERCPLAPPLTSYCLDRWLAAHTARQSQRAA